MTQVEPAALPLEHVSRMNDGFLFEGMNAKALIKAIVLADNVKVAAPNISADRLTVRDHAVHRHRHERRRLRALAGRPAAQ